MRPPPHEPTHPLLTLSDSATVFLRLCALHDGVSEGELVTRLVCERAKRIGLPELLDAEARIRGASG